MSTSPAFSPTPPSFTVIKDHLLVHSSEEEHLDKMCDILVMSVFFSTIQETAEKTPSSLANQLVCNEVLKDFEKRLFVLLNLPATTPSPDASHIQSYIKLIGSAQEIHDLADRIVQAVEDKFQSRYSDSRASKVFAQTVADAAKEAANHVKELLPLPSPPPASPLMRFVSLFRNSDSPTLKANSPLLGKTSLSGSESPMLRRASFSWVDVPDLTK